MTGRKDNIMQGSKRSTKRSWLRGRGPGSQRVECKYSIKQHKKYLNRKARHNKNLPNGCAYKKLAKEKVWEYVS